MWNKVPKKEYLRGDGYAPKKDASKIINDGVIYDPMGQWKYPGQVTKIPSNNITMKGVPYPVLGIDDTGYSQMMLPEMDYQFPGNNVTEYPKMLTGGVLQPGGGGRWLDSVRDQFNKQQGGDISITDLSQMKKGGWLNKYSKQTKLKGERGYTSKNIKTSINKLMLRNETLFGPAGKKIYDPMSKFQDGGAKTPEEWVKQIRTVEHTIGNPSQWDMQGYNLLQNKLNDYKNWRENTPEGRAVHDSHNEPNEYVVPLPPHLAYAPKIMKQGGWLSKYQPGGDTKKDYYAKSPEDYAKRNQMYSDSLAISKPGQDFLKAVRNKEINGSILDSDWAPIHDKYSSIDISKAYNRLTQANKKAPSGKYNDVYANDNTGAYSGNYGIITYKKPTQRVHPYVEPIPPIPPIDTIDNTSAANTTKKVETKDTTPTSKFEIYYNQGRDFHGEPKDYRYTAPDGTVQFLSEQEFNRMSKGKPVGTYKTRQQLEDEKVKKQMGGWLNQYQDGGSTYKIKAGDSLSKLARKFNTTVGELQKINNIKNANLIVTGKSLIVPKSATKTKIQIAPGVSTPTTLTPIDAVKLNIKTNDKPVVSPVVESPVDPSQLNFVKDKPITESKEFYKVPENTFNEGTVYADYKRQHIKDENGNDMDIVALNHSIPELMEPTYAGSHTEDKWGDDKLNVNTEGTIPKLKVVGKSLGPNIYRNSGEACIGSDGTTVTECTSGMQLALDYNTNVKGEDRKKLGIKGDAWNIGENIVKAGGTRYYDLTQNGFNKSNLKSNRDVKNYLDENKKKLKLDNKSIVAQAEVGDIVEMWYQNSPSQEKALENASGNTVTTHAGIVTEKDGKKYVTHNVHGVWHTDPLDKSLDKHKLHHGGTSIMVAGLVRPDYADNSTALETTGVQVNPNARFYSKADESSYRKSKETKWKTETPVGKESQEFNRGLAYYAPKVQADFGLTDKETEKLMKLSFGLFGKESGFGKGESYIKKEKRRKFINLYKEVAPDWMPEGDEMSVGKAQIKMDTVFDTPEKQALLKKYGITKDNIWDTENSAAALMLTSAINYTKFKKFSGADFDNMDNLTLQNILALAHNKGLDNVIKNEFTKRDVRTPLEKVSKLVHGEKNWSSKYDVEPYTDLDTKLEGFKTYSNLHLDPSSYSNIVADYADSLNVDYNKVKELHTDPSNFVGRNDVLPNTVIEDVVDNINSKVASVTGAIGEYEDKAKNYVKKGTKAVSKKIHKIAKVAHHPKAWLNKYI